MNFDYLTKIKNTVNLSTKKKTSHLLEGNFKSIQRGRSMEFSDLKEYDFGDNVNDIDWKSSSRTDNILVRRYMAEKKHNVLLVGDNGVKMLGDSLSLEPKQELALMTFGTLAYLSDLKGADFSLSVARRDTFNVNMFRSGTDHLERQLYEYKKYMAEPSRLSIGEVLDATIKMIPKRMIVFVITDLAGLSTINEAIVRRVTTNNDLLVVNIDDASMFTPGAFNLHTQKYVLPFFSRFSDLKEEETKERTRIMDETKALFRKYRVSMVTVSKEEEIIDKVIELLEKNNYGILS